MKDAETLPTMAFASQAEWEAWLEAHHADTAGLWLKIAKRGSGTPSVMYAEALESALCYGWIDGQKAALDGEHWLQKFTPRRARSVWSKVNRAKAEALIAAGRMRPPGLRKVELAKADGRWEAAYDSQRTIAVPQTSSARSRNIPRQRTSSTRWTARIAAPSSTESRARNGRRPAPRSPGGSSRCWSGARRSIRGPVPQSTSVVVDCTGAHATHALSPETRRETGHAAAPDFAALAAIGSAGAGTH